jgi:thiamine-monophosphate kinase
MIAEGVHFLPSDPPASVGWKLVTVNLSDLAGKGAEPFAALMGYSLGADPEWDERFLSGVGAACETYGLALVGGDTIALPEGAPRVFGLTAIGRGGETIPSRSGGKPGDALWLVGLLGDAATGLAALHADEAAEGPLVEAYRRPVPQLAVGRMLAPHVSAMMDVSDGLLLDAARQASAEGQSTSTNCPCRGPISQSGAAIAAPAWRPQRAATIIPYLPRCRRTSIR